MKFESQRETELSLEQEIEKLRRIYQKARKRMNQFKHGYRDLRSSYKRVIRGASENDTENCAPNSNAT